MLFLPLIVAVSTAAVPLTEAFRIVDRVNELTRGQTSHGRMELTVVRPRWTRTLEVEIWNQGRHRALIVARSPAKDAGTSTLKRDQEMWNYLPSVERVIKLPPSMMLQGWMGSDFSNNDVVKSDSLVVDYTHRLLKTEREGAETRYLVEATPKPDAPVVWGKVLLLAGEEQGNLYPIHEEDFDEKGRLVRTITFSGLRWMGGRYLPTVVECLPSRPPGRKTRLEHKDLQFDVPLQDGFFSVRTLMSPPRP